MAKYTWVYTNPLFYDAYGHGTSTYTISDSCWTCPRPSLSGWPHSTLWWNGHLGHERLTLPDEKEKVKQSDRLHVPGFFILTTFFIMFYSPYMFCSPVTLLHPHFDRCSTYLMRHGSPTTPSSSLYCNIRSAYGNWTSNYPMVWIWPRISRRTTWPAPFDAKQTCSDHGWLLSVTGTYTSKCTGPGTSYGHASHQSTKHYCHWTWGAVYVRTYLGTQWSPCSTNPTSTPSHGDPLTYSMGHWLSGFGFGVSLCWSYWGCLPSPQHYDNTWPSKWISPGLALPPVQLHSFDYLGSWDFDSIHPSTAMPQSQPRGHSPLSTWCT